MTSSKKNQSVLSLARVLAILGGLLVTVAGVLEFTSLLSRRNIPSLDTIASVTSYGFVTIVLGLVAVLASSYVRNLVWDVVLIVVGVVAYRFGGGFPWELGPIIVVVGGIVGIVGNLV